MEIQEVIKQRRMVSAAISPETLVEFFQPKHTGGLRIPQFDGIPEDAICTDVQYSFSLGLFVFKFYHESFERVPHGETIPIKYTEYRIIEFIEEPRQEGVLQERSGESEAGTASKPSTF